MAKMLEIPDLSEHLIRRTETETQTRKDRFQRWQNVESVFGILNPEVFKDKHILIVDDVITTGATIEAMCNAMLEIAPWKLSVAAIATARN